MKIILTATSPNFDSEIEPRFGAWIGARRTEHRRADGHAGHPPTGKVAIAEIWASLNPGCAARHTLPSNGIHARR